ncbi:LysE family translocator [Pseudaeromonas paramecii]|uniref:LysE family translocator n=1 Tax=Pseudaeromonas paramecii TaxID=2138166 RepID=A0ABP8Q8T1_9GAMM
MLGIHDLPLFIVSGLLLNLMPGPDSLFIMSQSARQGWRAGFAAAQGIGTGTLVHIGAAALGLSALLAASATAFGVVKLLGAAYLLYLGWQSLLPSAEPAASTPTKSQSRPLGRIFWQGFLTNALNPKVALFFLAFMPQFIRPDAPHKALAFIALGLLFNLNGMLWCHLLAWLTAGARRRLQLPLAWRHRLEQGMGLLFIGLGVRLALSGRN